MYPGHPRFMAYVSGAGTIPGAAADLLAAGLNMNAGGWLLSPSASEIERHLTATFARWFGLPSEAGRHPRLGRRDGELRGAEGGARPPRRLGRPRRAASRRTPAARRSTCPPRRTSSAPAPRTCSGSGTDAVRKIPVGADFRIRVDELRAAIRRDRDAGVRPDRRRRLRRARSRPAPSIPLGELADLCAEEGLWFHVDAAYGGPAAFTEDLAPLFAGIERADSIAFDPHKWLYTPLSGGCVLVRDLQFLSDSFSSTATYVHQDKERTGRGVDGSQLGPQFSRGNQSLKVWVSLLAHGRRAYAAADLPRRRARPVPRRSGAGATRLRARRRRSGCRSAASATCRRTCPRPTRPREAYLVAAERAADDGGAARRPHLLLQRRARRAGSCCAPAS